MMRDQVKIYDILGEKPSIYVEVNEISSPFDLELYLDSTQRRIWAYGLYEEVITRNQLEGLVDIINNRGSIRNEELAEITPRLIFPSVTQITHL